MRRLQFWIFLVLCGVFGYWINPFSPAASNLSTAYGSNQASHALALNVSGDTLLVVNPDSNSISLIETDSLTKLIEIPVGEDPRSVTINGNEAYVANQGSDSISVIDLATKSSTFLDPANPFGSTKWRISSPLMAILLESN